MTIEKGDQEIDVGAFVRELIIFQIRQRSMLSFSALRQIEYERLSQAGVKLDPSLKDFYGASADEQYDTLRDSNMITSADVLDLHLSELKDSETYGPRILSERTLGLAIRVAMGFVWTIDNEPEFAARSSKHEKTVQESLKKSGFKTKAMNLRPKLLSTDVRVLIIAIHQVLGLDHKEGLPRSPLKDLWFKDIEETHKFLNFLRDLK